VKGIAGLIRLGRWKLGGERKRLAALETQAAGYAAEIDRLGRESESEATLASHSVEAAASYSRYLSANLAARRNLTRSIEELQPQIDAVRKSVEEAFREVKAYELIEENRRRAERKVALRKEQARLDEIGAERHRRHGEHHAAAAVSLGDDRIDRVADGLGSEGVDEGHAARECDVPAEAGDAATVVEDCPHAVAVARGEGSARADDQLKTPLDDETVELEGAEAARRERDEKPPRGG
jgi:flagellar export protein FliJ